jgi:hypothetical protein
MYPPLGDPEWEWDLTHGAVVEHRRFAWADEGAPRALHPVFRRAFLRPGGFNMLTDLEQYGITDADYVR